MNINEEIKSFKEFINQKDQYMTNNMDRMNVKSAEDSMDYITYKLGRLRNQLSPFDIKQAEKVLRNCKAVKDKELTVESLTNTILDLLKD